MLRLPRYNLNNVENGIKNYTINQPEDKMKETQKCKYVFGCKKNVRINTLPDDKILDWSKMKRFADNNFKFDENSRKFSKRVEHTVGKGEIARYEQFLLFPQCFQKACFPGGVKMCGNGSPAFSPFSHNVFNNLSQPIPTQ